MPFPSPFPPFPSHFPFLHHSPHSQEPAGTVPSPYLPIPSPFLRLPFPFPFPILPLSCPSPSPFLFLSHILPLAFFVVVARPQLLSRNHGNNWALITTLCVLIKGLLKLARGVIACVTTDLQTVTLATCTVRNFSKLGFTNQRCNALHSYIN